MLHEFANKFYDLYITETKNWTFGSLWYSLGYAIPYGLLCFKPLVFFGLCQDWWRVCYLAGISGMGNITRTFGT